MKQHQILQKPFKHTVDGQNPAPVGMVNVPLSIGFYTSKRWLFGISSINRIIQISSLKPAKTRVSPWCPSSCSKDAQPTPGIFSTKKITCIHPTPRFGPNAGSSLCGGDFPPLFRACQAFSALRLKFFLRVDLGCGPAGVMEILATGNQGLVPSRGLGFAHERSMLLGSAGYLFHPTSVSTCPRNLQQDPRNGPLNQSI